jgi:hypothetical protein
MLVDPIKNVTSVDIHLAPVGFLNDLIATYFSQSKSEASTTRLFDG